MKRKILCIKAIDGFLGRSSSRVAMYQFIFLHFLFKSVDRASRETVYDAVCEILSSIAVICSEDLLVTNSEDPQFFLLRMAFPRFLDFYLCMKAQVMVITCSAITQLHLSED